MKFSKLMNILIVFLIILILIEMVILMIQNRRLKAQIVALRKEVPRLIIGDYAPLIEVINLKGEREFINFDKMNQEILLFIQSPSCIPCDKNFIFWRRLSYQLKDKVRILMIGLKELKDARNLRSYFRMDIPVYIPKNKEKFIRDYKVSNFSQTILIDRKGKVKWIKASELNGDDYFKLTELVMKNK